MSYSAQSELEKWEEYYASLPIDNEEEDTQAEFNRELTQKVLTLLPGGGKVLEAGCGAGWQSLALAQTGKFQVTLLDFSRNALEYARRLFERAELPAEFILADAFQPGQADFDLVFNSGVVEHYNPIEQKNLLGSMASFSRKYVLVLAPNRLCPWYWLWRIQATASGNWPFGKEAALVDLSTMMQQAGLHFVGQVFMAETWTESFIQGLGGLDESLREIILRLHRSPILSSAQKSYLVAGLGSVDLVDPAPPGWEMPILADNPGLPDLIESVALALSQNIRDQASLKTLEARIDQLEQELAASRVALAEVKGSLSLSQIEQKQLTNSLSLSQVTIEGLQHQLDESGTARDSLHQALEAEQALRESEGAKHEAQLEAIQSVHEQVLGEQTTLKIELSQKDQLLTDLKAELQNREQSIATLSGTLKEIYSSNGWRLVQWIWRTQVRMRAYRLFTRLEGGLRRVFHLTNQVRQPETSLVPPQTAKEVETSQPSTTMGQGLPWFIRDYLLSPSDIRVLLFQVSFFDNDGNNMFFGGAERYMIELARSIRELGHDPVIIQCGSAYWMRYYRDLRVIGLDVQGRYERLTEKIEELKPSARLVVYSPFSYASASLSIPAVGISHGVYWDDASFQYSANFQQKNTASLLSAIHSVGVLVSVDTTTINWIRSVQSDLVKRCVYVPNFVDVEEFHPIEGHSDRLIVLYPRRLYRPRGFWLLAEIIPALLDEFPQLDFHFVGKADAQEEIKVQELIQAYPSRVRHYFLPPEEMSSAYQKAQITIIPTVNSEGTSLSCLEAMASANAVIATNVGGLPDLILDHYNGLLIDPTPQSLKTAIQSLVNDPELRQELGRHARETATASFNQEIWRQRWREVLQRFLPARPISQAASLRTVVFPHTGIGWEGIKQRPHHLAVEFVQQGYEVFWFDPQTRGGPVPGVQLLAQKDDLYLSQPVLFIYYPFNYPEIERYDHPLVIYDVLDDISIHSSPVDPGSGDLAQSYYHKLLERADIVTASSRVLYDRVKAIRPDVLYLPNGIYLQHFDPENTLPADDLPPGHPLIGFHGAIADWLDVDLLDQVARLRPDYQFVLVGSVSIPEGAALLRRHKNIHLLNSVPYERIAAYIQGFDVGILPFKLNRLTDGVRPLKLLEYLAMGKPVVATPIAEIRDWPGIRLARTPQDFAFQIDEALQGGRADRDQTTEFLNASTWPQVVRPLMEALEGVRTTRPDAGQ